MDHAKSFCSEIIPSGYCGDGIINSPEICDDKNAISGDGCNKNCQIEYGWNCIGVPSTCFKLPSCGNGKREINEECDDGFRKPNDGCSPSCEIEDGYVCHEDKNGLSYCTIQGYCGDGIIKSPEICDDKNAISGDGCNKNCQIESGWNCVGVPSTCFKLLSCGNGKREINEECDDGFRKPNDGCSPSCEIEDGYVCHEDKNGLSYCTIQGYCGDGKFNPMNEECDDGSVGGNDGCVHCQVSKGWACYRNEPWQLSLCKRIAYCGNGIKESDEQCDDGNYVDTDACNNNCMINVIKECGNGKF